MYVYKDYQIIDKTLFKNGVDDSKHLLHKLGSVPCIDAKVWDKYGDHVGEIYIRTKKGNVFRSSADNFNQNKEKINYGFGNQYVMPKDKWKTKI